MKNQQKEIILIVGGGSGIGRACAKKFAEGGYNVFIAGRKKESLVNVCKEIKAKGGLCSHLTMDIKSASSIKKCMEQLNKKSYEISVFINSSGINVTNRTLKDMADKETQDIISTNLTGAINICRAVCSNMRKNKGGTIIQIGSSAGVKTSSLSGVAYSATKRALFSLVRSINLEEAKNGIRSSIISPATVNTGFILKRAKALTKKEQGQVIQPNTIADIAYFLAGQPRNVVIEQINMTSLSEVEFL